MGKLSAWAKLYVALTVLAGVYIAATASWDLHLLVSPRFAIYLAGAILASVMRVKLPGVMGTMSVNFVFTLISIVDLPAADVLMVTWAGILAQLALKAKHQNPIYLIFNLASINIAAGLAGLVYHATWARSLTTSLPILLTCSAAVLFLVNTFSVSGIIALTESKNPWIVWRDSFAWTASHYLVGAGMAVGVHSIEKYFGWEAVVLAAPVIYLVYRSYALHLSRLEAVNVHAKELGDLHWRAIEALALAIDAKDETTHCHLLRVRVYATEVARHLNLSHSEMEAIQAASLLHDIGKLAVPEHIISKPGKLTPEEFEKIKIHPAVGAEILERIRFPYPVVPIVRSHHEKWNGQGYPDGLIGEAIPIGARILAAVDCLDALASDRQYRKALPLDQAMEVVAAESGTSFDPRVIEVLKHRYIELEGMAVAAALQADAKLSTNVRFELGDAPAAGFEKSGPEETDAQQADFTVSMVAARHELHTLLKLTENLGASLTVEETLSLLAGRLRRMVPHDTIALYLRHGDELIPKYVSGEERREFSGLKIAIGEGLSGWVFENRSPIINGNPAVEPHSGATRLKSALSVPLEIGGEVLGTLSLYSLQMDCFTGEHLGVLRAVCEKAGVTIANALEYERAVLSDVTDEPTGLPNARSLFAHLEHRLDSRESDFALISLKINGSRQIHADVGQVAGNRVLQQVGQALANRSMPGEYVARLEGDEFVIIASNVTDVSLSNYLCALRGMTVLADYEGCLSLSVGAAFFPADGLSADKLLETAEKNRQEHENAVPQIKAA